LAETLLEELKRYVGFTSADEAALRTLHRHAAPHFPAIADTFYRRILEHESARKALVGGESIVGHLKVTLVAWMERLLTGPWDEPYFELRSRIGRMHVRIALPQHYMFGAMNVLRRELEQVVDETVVAAERAAARSALGRILDLELAIMLHTYREDLLAQAATKERLATFGQLMGSIGHELRNPLSVIETSLHLLRGRVGEDERARKHTERISQQVQIANSIISDLLDMIRDKPLLRERLSLAEVVELATRQVTRPLGVRLEVAGLTGLPQISGDASQLRQLLVNLIDNAVHAAGNDGLVRISGRQLAEAVSIDVEDSGPGVDEATSKRLFEPLVTTKQKGVGLGLALVKRIAERHGGRIGYQRAEAGGARFTLQLPLT
jgi:signal transduction histidine kinase